MNFYFYFVRFFLFFFCCFSLFVVVVVGGVAALCDGELDHAARSQTSSGTRYGWFSRRNRPTCLTGVTHGTCRATIKRGREEKIVKIRSETRNIVAVADVFSLLLLQFFPITFNSRFSHLRRVWVCWALLCDSLALSKIIPVRVVHMYVSALAHLITLTSIIDQLAAFHSGHDTLCSICYNSLAHDFFSIQITCFFCAESSAEQTSD